VIADYLPGLWDQHGKGRAGGVLDNLFGVTHDGGLRASDAFGERLWVEVDQDANYSWKTYEEFLTNENTCIRDKSGFHQAVRAMPVGHVRQEGRGTAVLMNLSPQWYNAFRVAGAVPAQRRDVFMRHISDAGVVPWVRLKGAGDTEHGYEITYWSMPPDANDVARKLIFVCFNPETTGNSLGGGNSDRLRTARVPVTLQFRHDVRSLRDERAGTELGDGREFTLNWKQNEALVLSFPHAPPAE
jgi:hypothetical protein